MRESRSSCLNAEIFQVVLEFLSYEAAQRRLGKKWSQGSKFGSGNNAGWWRRERAPVSLKT